MEGEGSGAMVLLWRERVQGPGILGMFDRVVNRLRGMNHGAKKRTSLED